MRGASLKRSPSRSRGKSSTINDLTNLPPQWLIWRPPYTVGVDVQIFAKQILRCLQQADYPKTNGIFKIGRTQKNDKANFMKWELLKSFLLGQSGRLSLRVWWKSKWVYLGGIVSNPTIHSRGDHWSSAIIASIARSLPPRRQALGHYRFAQCSSGFEFAQDDT